MRFWHLVSTKDQISQKLEQVNLNDFIQKWLSKFSTHNCITLMS